jgi:chemotaxis methyl-accepting protein methylase
MSKLAFMPFQYRHITFPDATRGDRLPFNFTTQDAGPKPKREGEEDLSGDEYESVGWLLDKAGLSISDYRPETIKRRIPACIRAVRVATIRDVCTTAGRHPELLRTAISALMIGVSSFFRDASVFETLGRSILPQLLADGSWPRIWSAGCSEGAELYSVAMLLAEQGALPRCELLGTDCRADAIARARAGTYTVEGIKGVPDNWLPRYFITDGRGWRAHPSLRTGMQWRSGNVLNTPEPGLWDLILCRNMAIYLHAPTAGRLWAQLEQSLRPGGVLVLGKAERPHGATTLRPIAPCIFRRDRS